MKKSLGMIFLLVMFSLNFVVASFSLGNATEGLTSQYGPLNDMKGWINISFSDENSNSMFTDSFENSISLIDLLKTNSNYDYECSVFNCSSDYSADNGATTKSFSLGVGASKTIGLKFENDITAINSIKFIVESDADQSCFNQLTVDFLADGESDFGNTHSTIGDCSFSKNYGCFVNGTTTNEYVIGENANKKYCQKINLSESPGFKIGAWVKSSGDARNLTATIYSQYGEPITGASCNINVLNTTEGELSCEVDYLVTKTSPHFVCIYSNVVGTSKIKGYSLANGCGFYGISSSNQNAAFQIFAEGKKFGNVGTINVTNSLSNGNTLGSYAEDYIIDKYDSLDCSDGCVVPIKFFSQRQQNIVINNLEIQYETIAPTTGNNFYDVTEIPAKINSGFQKLFLDGGGFSLPQTYGNHTFILDFKGDEIITKKITIEEVPTILYITPTETASAYPTIFRVKASSTMNITKYDWDFGDGKVQTTNVNQITHTYNATGEYSMKITITDNLQRSSDKTFNIGVKSPEEIINKTLLEMRKNLVNTKSQLNEFTIFEKESLDKVLQLVNMEDKLKQAQRDYQAAISEADYNQVMTSLLEIKIPESIITTKITDFILFYPEEENVNLEILKKIGGGEYESSKEDSLVNGVFSWYQENLDVKLKFSELSAQYKDYEEPILRIFDLDVKKKNSGASDAYIILENLENLKFKENYLEREESGYVVVDLNREEKNLVFSTTEDVDFVTLPLFISPEIARLPLIEIPEIPEEGKKWGLFIAIIIVILIIAMGIYIFLQEWYKRKYENYLFKNRNDLYNIVNFIQNSRDKKIDEKKIVAKLRAAGWNLEQVTYAMKKYSGKRTGMLEIPINFILNLFKKKPSNIEGNQYNPQYKI